MRRTLLLAIALWALVGCSVQQAISTPDVVDIENPVVAAFMAKGPYSDFGSERSYFADEKEFPVKYAKDKPVGVALSWKGGSSEQYSLSLYSPSGAVFENRVINGNATYVTNLIPGLRYDYTVAKDGRTIARGSFRTTGQVRMLEIDESCNARDLGGWNGLGGHTIRYGWLYRTGSIDGSYSGVGSDGCGGDRCRQPAHDAAQTQVGNATYYSLNPRTLEQLSQIGIAADLDLRGVTGEGAWGTQCMPHSRSLGQTMIPGADFAQIMTDFALYNPLENTAAVRDVRWIIEELRKGHPVAFHCRSGADRTGAIAMLIEALLGVSPGDIAMDYELTSLSSEGNGQTRSAQSSLRSGYGFFARGFTTLEVTDTERTSRIQRQAYKYLNDYFPDERISSDDLDWFIDFMLGTSIASSLRPTWARP